jgi:hypothetical protein
MGAAGARILAGGRSSHYGLGTTCIGGGLGLAAVFQAVNS